MANSYEELPYTAISISIIARFIFMYLLYTKRSVNNLSLLFCILNICSSSLWTYYSLIEKDTPMIIRSSTEMVLLTCSAVYIIRNKIQERYVIVLPITDINANTNANNSNK
jgi:uncharacterized protein with PQ loop repeat